MLIKKTLPPGLKPKPIGAAAGPGPSSPEPVDLSDLTSSLKRARRAMLNEASPLGAWQTPYNLGIVPGLMASVALHFVGEANQELLNKDKAMFADAMASQNSDGSFNIYEGGPKTKEQTRLFKVAAEYALEKNPQLSQDQEFEGRLRQAIQKAHAFTKSGAPSTESIMFTSLVNLFDDLTSPGEELTAKLNPMRPGVVKTLLHTGLGKKVTHQLMAPMPGILPAMALLNHHSSQRAKPTLLTHLSGRTGPLSQSRESTLHTLENDVLDWQDSNGGWVYTAIATSLAIMALKTRGYPVDSPQIQAGLSYLDKARFATEEGERVSFLDASVWDTAVAGDALLSTGIRADHPLISVAIDRLLESQHEDGRWAFALESEHIPDTDDAAMAVRFLTRALDTAKPEQKKGMRQAISHGVDSCLKFQQKDGGWNSYEPSIFSWGRRVPHSYEAAALDPSTPDVAGRILGALGMVEQKELLSDAQREGLRKAREQAVDYLKDSQRENGTWWGRWTSGLNSSPAFVLPGLRWAGLDVQADWVQKCRDFYLMSQNEDGGWGESVEADKNPDFAGVGESTPAQTAYGILALLAASPKDDISSDQTLKRAVDYLLAQERDGEWMNGRDIYTTVPGLSYYDAPLMTTAISSIALATYESAMEHGVGEAFRKFAQGPQSESA